MHNIASTTNIRAIHVSQDQIEHGHRRIPRGRYTTSSTIHDAIAPHFIMTKSSDAHLAEQIITTTDVVPGLSQPLMSISNYSSEHKYTTIFDKDGGCIYKTDQSKPIMSFEYFTEGKCWIARAIIAKSPQLAHHIRVRIHYAIKQGIEWRWKAFRDKRFLSTEVGVETALSIQRMHISPPDTESDGDIATARPSSTRSGGDVYGHLPRLRARGLARLQVVESSGPHRHSSRSPRSSPTWTTTTSRKISNAPLWTQT